MDITQVLKDTENAVRDFIAFILSEKFGPEWEENCGVSSDRINRWKERKESERIRQESGAPDERLIYYADFYDLKTILKKNWDLFSKALGHLTTTDVWLTELERLRDADAHRRELLPHQKHLILGVAGELRTRIARYRSKQETSESYYPRIEFAADNLGNTWRLGERSMVYTDMKLRPGDELEYIVTASDPLDEPLKYQFTFGVGSPGHSDEWSTENTFTFLITEKYVGKSFYASITIRSDRKYHARKNYDDSIDFRYEVLPPMIDS
jgi:hypothetical protein